MFLRIQETRPAAQATKVEGRQAAIINLINGIAVQWWE